MQLTARERLVLALDVDDLKKADELVDKLSDYVGVFKIGSQLFTAEGAKVVNMVNKRGGKVFLDLKFHDIPNTVARAAEVATKLGVYIFNVHTSGGYEMMKAAAEATKKISLALGVRKPLILGVTLLTSINQKILEKEISVKKKWEIKEIRKACGENFVILTPGIRPAGKSSDDQKRVMTPREAIKLGSDFLVIGRPIRDASNPVEAAKEILKEMEEN